MFDVMGIDSTTPDDVVVANSTMPKNELLHERLTESIVGGFYDVYNALGYGFIEKTYSRALEIELGVRGLRLRRQVQADIYYRERFVISQRIDLFVVESVVVEVKAADTVPPIAVKQCQSCRKALERRVGLVLNFGIEPQIKRVFTTALLSATEWRCAFRRARARTPVLIDGQRG
jgi:GxxExxY protein